MPTPTPSNPLNKPLAQGLTSEELELLEVERKRKLWEKVIAGRQSILMDKGKITAVPGKSLNPNTRYAWVNRNEHRVTMFQAQGYAICRNPDVHSDWKREDNTHIYGDLILMEIDRELWETSKLYSQMKAIEGVEGEEVFKAFAERAGIPVLMPKS